MAVFFTYKPLNDIWERKFAFFVVFTAIATLTYGALYALDFYPELNKAPAVAATTTPATTVVSQTVATMKNTPSEKPVTKTVDPYPNRLIIEKLDKDVKILNPKSTDVEVLDQTLLSGAARHPDSADFVKQGTMLLFGHSSYLPFVHNKNYQAFNGIQKLEWGDLIRLQSTDTEYLYRVQKVYGVKASAATADIQWGKPKLILITCNSFGTKDDRYVVEATLIDSYPLGSKTQAL